MHAFECRVYYEDTDLAGIVYYANYLKFIERARTEALISLGIDQAELKVRGGIVFAVRRVEVDYLKPAVFQDLLKVSTRAGEISGARVELFQDVWRGDVALVRARVQIVCLGPQGRPVRMPEDVRSALGRLAE
jgi:acyl-CoA thioester hydrolase